MDDQTFIEDYLNRYRNSLFETDVSQQMIELKEMLLGIKKNGKKVIIAGNGGSAAMASHVTVDFTKQGGIRTVNFNEADLITCFANDYGFEHWVAKAIEFYGDENDMLILISSSGNSPNVVRALEVANKRGMTTAAVLGYSGGLCLGLADMSVHFEVDDMQIAEDLQLIVGHMCMQWLLESKKIS